MSSSNLYAEIYKLNCKYTEQIGGGDKSVKTSVWYINNEKKMIALAKINNTNVKYTSNKWDDKILNLLKIKKHILPKVLDCADDYGSTHPSITGKSISITGVVGDQQSATIGQCCFEVGSLKSTYGTGAFVLLNTGNKIIYSKNRLFKKL